jgi:hypothetical protein
MMVQDDRSSHPMTCGAEFTFQGRLDRKEFEWAVEQACGRHPLFCAHVESRCGQPWAWVAARDRPQVNWVGEGQAVDYERAAPIDLARQLGLRIWVQERLAETRLLFDFHHACADGAGGLTFVEDLLTLYSAAIDGRLRGEDIPQVNQALLYRRGRFPRALGFSCARLADECADVRETCRFLTTRPEPLAQAADPAERARIASREGARRLSVRTFPREFLTELRSRAAACGATVNDLLLCALFMTLHEWNARRRCAEPRDWLRIVMPVNLRTRADLEMPAANRMSYAFITRRRTEMSQPATLLSSISAETTWIRKSNLPHRVLSKLSMFCALPSALRWILAPQRCLATAVLSNMGDPTRRFRSRFPRRQGCLVAGNVVLTGFSGITPLRPLTRAALFASTYGGRLSIAARFDPTCFNQADTQLFLEQFATHLGAPAEDARQIRAA